MSDYSWQKMMLWASFIFFLGALLLRQEAAINQDLGRHLRLGEMIVSGGQPNGVAREARKCALFTNCLTYTYPDYPFINHHWGSEIIFYLIYKLGGFGALILFKALVLGAAFLITVRHASAVRNTQNTQKAGMSENQRARVSDSPAFRFSDTSGSPSFPSVLKLSVAMILIFLSVNMMADRLTARPEIFGYLLFSLLFLILDRRHLGIWGILGIWGTMLLWVNLHISFVFGVILVWLWGASRLLASLRGIPTQSGDRGNPGDRHAPLRQGFAGLAMTIGVPAISTLVTVLNPAGLRGALMPLSIMKDYGYTIVENMTPFFLRAFKPQPEYWIYAAILLATIILGVVRGFREIGGFGGMTILIFSVFPLIAVRHLAFFGLVMPVVLTPLIRSLLAWQGDSWSISGKFAKLPILVAGGLMLAAVTNPAPLAYAKLPAVSLAADPRHDEAIKFVKQNHFQGKMWNNYDIGSYLEWSLPEHPTFVDGRPEAFPAGFFQETYIPMQESRQKWDEVATKYDIQWVFAALTDATPWFGKWRAMIGRHEGWKVVYIDNATAILERQN